MWIGKEKNRLLQANAWHHRSDALSSVAALIGIEELNWANLWIPCRIGCSALIMETAWDMGKQSVDELTDAVTDPEVESQVHQLMSMLREYKISMKSGMTDGIISTSRSAHRVMGTTVSSAHQIAERARLRITQSLPVTEVLVHVDPELTPIKNAREEFQLMRPDEIEQDIVSVLERVPQVSK